MVDVFPGLGAFTSMLNSVKALKDINDAVVRNSTSIDLLQKILEAREAYSALLDKVGELEQELRTHETWESEKQRYELKPHGERQALAYALKEGTEPLEPTHSICPDCYQERRKSILQQQRRSGGRLELLICQVCGWEGITHGIVVDPQPKVVTRQHPGRKPSGMR